MIDPSNKNVSLKKEKTKYNNKFESFGLLNDYQIEYSSNSSSILLHL